MQCGNAENNKAGVLVESLRKGSKASSTEE